MAGVPREFRTSSHILPPRLVGNNHFLVTYHLFTVPTAPQSSRHRFLHSYLHRFPSFEESQGIYFCGHSIQLYCLPRHNRALYYMIVTHKYWTIYCAMAVSCQMYPTPCCLPAIGSLNPSPYSVLKRLGLSCLQWLCVLYSETC
jgi:hypothetical protein